MKKYYIIGIILSLIIGFFVGRTTSNENEIKYVKGETIKDSIPYNVLVPKYIKIPIILKYAEKIKDTIRLTEKPINKDSSLLETLKDFNIKRVYNDYLFKNDTLGELKYDIEVQYNRINKLKYEYTPIIKNVSTIKKRKYIPYISSSYSTFNIFGIGGGLYINNVGLGLEYQYDYNLQKNGLKFGINYKF